MSREFITLTDLATGHYVYLRAANIVRVAGVKLTNGAFGIVELDCIESPILVVEHPQKIMEKIGEAL
jgi:hypothetical protein